MSWQNHIRKVQVNAPDTYLVDAEMRQAIASYIEEVYGIHPGCCNFDEIGENFCKFTLNIGGQVGPHVWIEFYFHDTGRVEATLCIEFSVAENGTRRIPLPSGQLPPDNETFADLVATETTQTWSNIPAGWHPAHEQIIAKLKEYAESNGLRDDVFWIGGWYPDGTETRHMGDSFPLTPKGLRQALTLLRADLKGGQAWEDAYTGERDEGNFCMMILPGECNVPEDESYLTLDPTDYSTIVSNRFDDDSRWENVLPM
jgi:hypothetical protein